MMTADIYKAMGDPIRLTLISRLAANQPLSIGDLSKNLGISRQGARKQIQVLVDAELVELRPQGRSTEVLLQSEKLRQARDFITHLEAQWDQRLAALKNFVED